MATNNWRPPQVREPPMDAGNWGSQLQLESRPRIVNMIMDALKRHFPCSGQESSPELKKIAVRFEEMIYTAATSESDYFEKIALKIYSLETRSQNAIENSSPINSAGNINRPPDPDSAAQTGHATRGDWQEVVYQKANMNSIQSNSGMLQHQHIKQQQEQEFNYVNELKMRRAAGQCAFSHQQLKSGPPFPISSTTQFLQAASPKISQHSSPQNDQQNLLAHTKAGTSSSPFVIPSPSTPMAPSSVPGDSEKPSSLANAGKIGQLQATVVGSQIQSLAIGTPGISASPLLAEFSVPDGTHVNALSTISGKSNVTEQPLERLIKAVKSMSSNALSASVSDIGSVVSMSRIAGSAPGKGSRDAVGEDLITMTKCCLQGRNVLTRDGTNGSRKIRRFTSAVPLNVVPSAGNDCFRQLASSETSDLESTVTSRIKRPRIEANHALLEEIREIRQRLINTVVDISDEDDDPSAPTADGGKGTIFKCFFDAVAFGLDLKLQYASAQMSPIHPLRLLVPSNYPNCSPMLLDKFPVEVSKEYEDLSVKAKSKFSISLRSISEPMSLGEIARTWDVCACAVISEHAQQSGGGSFSSRYGTWENCLGAA